jgi:hypothetical protein
MSETEKVRATLTFFGETHPIPKPGEQVMLHVADGSWRAGFRCISGLVSEDGEERVWVACEEEWQAAKRAGRQPMGDTWPITEMAQADD